MEKKFCSFITYISHGNYIKKNHRFLLRIRETAQKPFNHKCIRLHVPTLKKRIGWMVNDTHDTVDFSTYLNLDSGQVMEHCS